MLTSLGLDPAKIAVERNLEIVPRSTYDQVAVADGDRFEIVHFIGGGNAPVDVPRGRQAVRHRGQDLSSRLIIGTGKYKTYADNAAALEASGAEIVTVAVRRVNLTDPEPAPAGGFHRSEEIHLSAQHRRLLHRRGCGAHPAPGARGRRLDAGEAGSAGRRRSCFIPT